MVSKFQQRMCSILLFSCTVSPAVAAGMSPALADTASIPKHVVSTPVSSHHPFFASVLHGIASYLSHVNHSTLNASSVTKINQATDTGTKSTSAAVWRPKTVSVTPLPENQPFVGLNTAQPKHPYLEGLRDIIAVTLDAFPNPIPTIARKFGFTPDVIVPKGEPKWSGMDVTNYSGPIPQASGVPMKAVHLDPTLMVPNAGQGYRMMYSTTNVEGDPAVSTAEILLPKGQAPAGGWKFINWAHGTTSLGDVGTPSATPRYDASYFNHLLGEGYAVISSDYVGLGTPGTMSYIAAKSEANNVNDATLAAKKIQGLPLSNTFMIDGHSQGGGAALAAADDVRNKIKGTDLDYRGAVSGAPAPNLTPIAPIVGTSLMNLLKLVSPMTAGHSLFAVEGVRVNKASGLDMDKYLTPYGKEILDKAGTESIDAMTDLGKTVDFRKMWTMPTYKIPGFSKAFQATENLPMDNIKDPTLVTQGFLDGQVPAPFTMLMNIGSILKGQKNIQYKYYPLTTHMIMNIDGTRSMADMDKFINQQMGGSGVAVPATNSVIPAPAAAKVDLLH